MAQLKSFIQLQNKAEIIASFGKIKGDIQDEVIKKMKVGGNEVKERLRAGFPVSTNPEQHSQPGSVPASQSGNLARKIQATVLPVMLNQPVTLNIHVTEKGFYGRMLEFGTSKMSARPWFYSGITKMFPMLRRATERAMADVIKNRNKRKRSKSIFKFG